MIQIKKQVSDKALDAFKTHLVNGNKAITAPRSAFRNVNKKRAKKKNDDSVPLDDLGLIGRRMW